jgi:hypothetical protein
MILLFVTYTKKFPLGDPDSPVIRNPLPPYSPDDLETTVIKNLTDRIANNHTKQQNTATLQNYSRCL